MNAITFLLFVKIEVNTSVQKKYCPNDNDKDKDNYNNNKGHAYLYILFSSRCRSFHNAIFFGSCNIQTLNKILKKILAPKG